MSEYDKLIASLDEFERLREARKNWSPELRQKAEEWRLQIARDRAASYRIGEETGLREALHTILSARFSALPAALETRIATAQRDELSALIERALSAETITDV